MGNHKDNLKFISFFLTLFILFISTTTSAQNLLEKGIAEFKAENYEEALELLKKAKEQQPDSPIVAFYLGLTYKQMGDYREALRHYKDAITLKPPVVDAYPELIEMLYNLNEFKEAEEWIKKAEKEDVKPGHIAFLKGLIFSKQDKNKAAIEAFKKAKELDKSLSQAADFQIAMLYAKDRRLGEAKDALKAVISIDPTSELANFAKEYEAALTKALKAHKTWRFTLGAQYQYDDNVVSKPTTSIGVAAVDEITGKRDSSMAGSFKIDFSPFLSGPWFFNGQYSVLSNNYFHTYSHDITAQSISLTPGYNFKNGALTLPLSYTHVWLNEREYMSLTSLKPTLNMMLFPGHIGQFSVGYGKRDMLKYLLKGGGSIAPEEDRDADIYSISAGYLHPFLEGRGMVNLRYEFSKDDTDGANWANQADKINLSLLLPVISKVNLVMSGDMLLQYYKDAHTISGIPGYPATPSKRRDKIYSGSAGIIWEVLKDINFNLQYSHTRADSNFAIYDYKKTTYSAGIEYKF